MRQNFNQWVAGGNPWVWLTAGAVSLSLVMVFGLLILIAMNGLAHFWPGRIAALELVHPDGKVERLLGEIVDEETVAASRVREAGGAVPRDMTVVRRFLIKVGNRDIGENDFRWIPETELKRTDYPPDAVTAERAEWGNFYGFVTGLKVDGKALKSADLTAELAVRVTQAATVRSQIKHLEKDEIGAINQALEALRVRAKRFTLRRDQGALANVATERKALEARFAGLSGQLAELAATARRDVLVVKTIDGTEREIPVQKIVRVFHPNAMSWSAKLRHYGAKLREFVTDDPREANTEGGVLPAIFGTVLMVLVMSVIATPFGVIAAIYPKYRNYIIDFLYYY